MKKLIAGLLAYVLTVSPVFAQATLLPNAKQTFLGTTGDPLAGGTVTFFVPGSTNKKTTWQDSGQVSNNPNPITLDQAGRATIFGQGDYRQVVKDAQGNTVWDAVTSAVGSSEPSGATGTDTAPVGTIIPYSGFVLPLNWQFAAGQALSRIDFSDLETAITIQGKSVSCVASSPVLSGWTDTSQIRVGAPVEATCLPTGTTVTAVTSSTSITVSNNATSSASVAATVFPWGNGDGALTFNVPDLRGVMPSGADAMGGTAANKNEIATTINTTNGSTTALIPVNTGVAAGMTIVSANIPAGTTAQSVNTSIFTTISTTNTSTSATVPSSTGLFAGMAISATGIPGGTTISSIAGTTITLSAAATATQSNVPVTFSSSSNASVVLSSAATATASGTAATFQIVVGGSAPAASGGALSRTLALNELPTNIPNVATSTTTITPNSTYIAGTGTVNFGQSGSGTVFPNGSITPSYSAATTTTVTVNPAGGAPHVSYPPTLTVNYIIKVKANTTGAGGVVSLGGMFGDIVCDATFQCLPQGSSPAVNTVGVAQQANNTVLANVSGSTAQPLPNTWTQWMDSVCGSTEGMIVFRDASAWNCLAPGTAGFVLSTNGSSAAPSWISAPTVTPQAANTVYSGPSSGPSANPTFRSLVTSDLPTTLQTGTTIPSPTITGGTIDNTPIGGTTPAAATFTSISASGSAMLGDNTVLIADSGGNGSIEIGDSGSASAVPFIDFHLGVSGSEDYNVRVQNTANKTLSFVANSGVDLIGSISPSQWHDASTTASTSTTTGALRVDGGAGIAGAINAGGNIASSGTVSGTNLTTAGNTTGNAATATKLATARTIAGQSFDGTANISIACGNLSNGSASCSTDTTNATNISSGTLNAARLPSQAARLDTADQTITGGANVTPQSLTTGNITIDCGSRPIQSITNGGAFTITAPSSAGYCILDVTNNASAGAITFSGFNVGSNTGDALTTTSGNEFFIFIYRGATKATYSVKALQ